MEENKLNSGAAVMEAPKPEAPAQPVQPAQEATPKAEVPALFDNSRTFMYSLIIFVCRILLKILFFIRYEGVENVPQGRNAIFMGNHTSMIDPVSICAAVRDREISFMGKKELFDNKFLCWLFTSIHAFPVDRGNMDMSAIRNAMNILKSGASMGIFPEGTRSREGHMLPLLSGASMLAVKSGCDVVPVYIDGGYHLFRRTIVRIGKPISTKEIAANHRGKAAIDALTVQMEASFAELSNGKSLPPAK